MTDPKFEFLVLGSTGLCGASFVKNLNQYIRTTANASVLETIIRKPYQEVNLKQFELGENEVVNALVEQDSSKWAVDTLPNKIANKGNKKIFFTGLGTTKADAGGIENQRKIDLDLNFEVAKSARQAGFTTCVLVSSSGANANSMFAYLKMKGELEEKLKELNFENLIILRPGALLGERHGKHKGFGNSAAAFTGNLVYGTMFSKFLGYPVHGEEVGKAGVKLALKAASAESPLGVQIYSSSQLIEIAKD